MISQDELIFFQRMPSMLPAYERLREELDRRYGRLGVKVSKTQISYKNRYIFSAVSFQRAPGCPREFFLVSFGLGWEKRSPRIAAATEAARNRWTHHVIIRGEEDIDGELLGWLDEAWRFSMEK